jgi:tetratricopeptide (TPR) repeat protein
VSEIDTFSLENSKQAEATRQQDGAMPRPLKPTNTYASWTALFGATVQRLRQELSVQPVVTQVEFGRRVCASGSKVSAIERGQVRPDAAFVEACERELPAGGILRAMLPLVIREWEYWGHLGTTPPTGGLLTPDGMAPPAEVAATPAELADVAFLEAAADGGAVEAAELAREAEASDIGAGTLENIDLAVDRLRRNYASAPPALLIPRVQGRLRILRRLHTGRLNIAQRRQLLVAGGWLATLLATLQFDTGDQTAAEDSRDAALQLGKAAGHQEIMAWSFELLAWFALVNNQPRQAIDLAQQGLTLAPNTAAGVQLAMQQARVWARLGAHRETEEALRAGATALARLPSPNHPEDHFAFDAAKLSFYAAMCFTWLHQTEQAEEHARQVIAHSTETPGVIRWPTRFAVAQVDLALLAVQRGQPDEAALRGTAALDSGRVVTSTLGWFAELDDLLIRDHSALPEVQDFHDRFTLVRRSASQRSDRR